MDPFCYLCFVSVLLSCLFIAALWSPVGNGINLGSFVEWTQSNAQKNIEPLQSNNQCQRINNNRTSALERTAAKATGEGGGGGA